MEILLGAVCVCLFVILAVVLWKYISMKLDEQARSTTSQLMKVKEIVSKH